MTADTLMTAKQARFIDEYLVDANGTQAAIRAGYGASGARVAAHRLLTNVAISSAIEARQRVDATRLSVDRDRVLTGLLEAFELAREMGQPAAMVSAARELGRLMGFYQPIQTNAARSVSDSKLQVQLGAMTDGELFQMIAEAEVQVAR